MTSTPHADDRTVADDAPAGHARLALVAARAAGSAHGRAFGPDALMASGGRPALAAISLWDAQLLWAKDRLQVDMPLARWLTTAAEAVEVMPTGVEFVFALDALPPAFHGDPVDRIIVATARAHGLAPATHDRVIRQARLARLWKAQRAASLGRERFSAAGPFAARRGDAPVHSAR